MKWLQLWKDGYSFDFISPYPIQICEQILNDHSRHAYLKNNPIAFLNERKQYTLPFVDVHHLTFDVYEFQIECALGWETRKNHKIEINGTFTRHVDGTQVKGSAKPNRSAKTDLWAWIGWLLFVTVFISIGSLIPPITEPPQLLLFYWVQPIFWGWLCWQSFVNPINQFIQKPQKWLGSAPISMGKAIKTHGKVLFKAPFDIYAPMSMSVCMEQLRKGGIKQHYQHTQAGMKLGTDIYGDLFITFEEESSEKSYFLLERSMWLSQLIPYNTPACAIGNLQVEEDMIHIQGYSYLPNRHIYPYLILLGLIVIVSAVLLSPWMLLISPILYRLMQYWINRRVRPFQRYPEQAIFRQKPMPQRRNWLGLRYEFDFYSPYPIADCMNMLLNYTIVGDYEDANGIHKSTYTPEGYLVTVTESADEKFSFSIKNVDKRGKIRAEAIGKLESVGYSTRVSGASTSKIGWTLIIVVIGACTVLIPITSLAIWLLLFFSMLAYGEWRSNIFSVGKYAQQTLGSRGERKNKKDATDE